MKKILLLAVIVLAACSNQEAPTAPAPATSDQINYDILWNPCLATYSNGRSYGETATCIEIKGSVVWAWYVGDAVDFLRCVKETVCWDFVLNALRNDSTLSPHVDLDSLLALM